MLEKVWPASGSELFITNQYVGFSSLAGHVFLFLVLHFNTRKIHGVVPKQALYDLKLTRQGNLCRNEVRMVAENIRKKFGLDKPKFKTQFPNLLETQAPWLDEKWDDFLTVNKKFIDLYTEKLKTAGPGYKQAFNSVLKEICPRQDYATIAKEYAPALALLTEGLTGNDKGKLQQAIQSMQKVLETCGTLESGKGLANDVKKKIAAVEKEMSKM